jgi:hypothetical protein
MSTNEHPITPPPELVEEWCERWKSIPLFDDPVSLPNYIAAAAAQWGANQELEACCEWLKEQGFISSHRYRLCSCRRPNSLSIRQQALMELSDAVLRGDNCATSPAMTTIRRAIEALPND